MCRSFALLLVAGAASAQPVTEVELVEAYLQGPVFDAELSAWEARVEAAETAPGAPVQGEVEYRHDEARGPAGARTDAIGGSLTLDLGYAGRRSAGEASGRASRAERSAAVLGAVCALREDAGALWFAAREGEARAEGQARLERLAENLVELAAAGESSGYDRDRAQVAAAAHRVSLLEASAAASAARARLAGRLGRAVDSVVLAPPPPAVALEGLLDAARADHPTLAALRLRRDAASRERDAARSAGAPGLRLQAAARFDEPPEGGGATPGFEAGVALEIPGPGAAARDVADATAELRAAEARALDEERRVLAAVEGAWARARAADALPPVSVDPARVWDAAVARYQGGEASIDELLQTARDVEDALVARLALLRLRRDAGVELSCAVGRFADPDLQSALQGALR